MTNMIKTTKRTTTKGKGLIFNETAEMNSETALM